MTSTEKERLYKFLSTYWYERLESDKEIVQSILKGNEGSISDAVYLIQQFLDSDESIQSKGIFIQGAVWRHVSGGSAGYVNWLSAILKLLEQSQKRAASS
jgi:hypothetical protein